MNEENERVKRYCRNDYEKERREENTAVEECSAKEEDTSPDEGFEKLDSDQKLVVIREVCQAYHEYSLSDCCISVRARRRRTSP